MDRKSNMLPTTIGWLLGVFEPKNTPRDVGRKALSLLVTSKADREVTSKALPLLGVDVGGKLMHMYMGAGLRLCLEASTWAVLLQF